MFQPNPSEITKLISLANQLSICPSEKPYVFCKLAKILSDELPERIKQVLKDFIFVGTENEYLLIDGLSSAIGELADTPPNNTHKVGEKRF